MHLTFHFPIQTNYNAEIAPGQFEPEHKLSYHINSKANNNSHIMVKQEKIEPTLNVVMVAM